MSPELLPIKSRLPLSSAGISFLSRQGRTVARHTFNLVLALGLVCALAGCGKKGAPTAPPGEPDTFPRVYPRE